MLDRLFLGSRLRVFVTYALLALAPLLVFGTYSLYATQENLRERERAIKQQTAGSAANMLDVRIQTMIELGVSMSHRSSLQERLREGDTASAVPHLDELAALTSDIDRVTLVDPEGEVIAVSSGSTVETGTDLSHREWFQSAVKTWQPYVSQVFSTVGTPRRRTFSIAVPIGSPQERLAVLNIIPRETFVADIMRPFERRPWRGLYVIDKKGTSVYSSPYLERRIAAGAHPIEALAEKTGAGSFEGLDPGLNARVVAGFARTRAGFLIIAQATQEEAYESLRQAAVSVGVALAVFAVLAFGGAYVTSHLYELTRERARDLERANADLESFSYSVSHDLRAPLRAIDGFSLMLQEKYETQLDDEARRLIGVVRNNTQKMGRLIDDLLAFSRAGRLPFEATPIDLSDLARSALIDLAPQLEGRDIEIQVEETPSVEGDRAMMKHAIANLLGNAIKFTRETRGATVRFSASQGPAEVIFSVSDNGAGYDPQYADKLFGVFQRLHSADQFEGTGIGLAIVKRIVERHGGRVWAESSLGEGAKFSFALPTREERRR